jgi:hypothetical protein
LEEALKNQEERASQQLARVTHTWRLREQQLREDMELIRSEKKPEVEAPPGTTQHVVVPPFATTDDESDPMQSTSYNAYGRPGVIPVVAPMPCDGRHVRMQALHASFQARVLSVRTMLARGSSASIANLPPLSEETQILLNATEQLWTAVHDQCFDVEESAVPLTDKDAQEDVLELMSEQQRLMDVLSSELVAWVGVNSHEKTIPPVDAPTCLACQQRQLPSPASPTGIPLLSIEDRTCCAGCLVS